MEIPKQIRNKNFRFVKIVEGTKRPVGNDWATSNNFKYSDPKFKEYLKTASAVGILGGYGKVAIVDADCEEVAKEIMFKLPKTFTTKTGSGKWHFYYIISDLEKTVKMINKGVHYGEVQFTGAQALIPGSKHPNGNNYEILHTDEVQTITKDQLMEVIKPFTKEEIKFQTVNSGFDLDIGIIASKISGLDSQGEFGLQGSHPIHGSEGGMNFRIDLDKNNWHCFRCSTGGDTLSLIGVLEGIIKCEDCKSGYFKDNPKKFKQILEKAGKYGYEGIEPREDVMSLFRSRSKGALNVQGIVEYIKENCSFVVIRDSTGRKPHIYVYRDGYYSLNGEEIIISYIKGLFKNIAWKSQYKNEVMDFIKTENIVDRDEIQPPKHLINVGNGVFNLKTKKLLPHDPKYYFLYKIPRSYDKKAKCPQIMKYLNSTLSNEYIKLTQEIFGYCLYFDYRIPGIFYLYGTGGNGKSVWLFILEQLLGRSNITNKSVDSLVRHRFTSSSLYGKLANICGELNGSVLRDTDMLKRLSAGESIQAEFKGKDAFDFPNKAKIITACNSIPYCVDMTDGWYQRQYIIPFLKKFRDTRKEDINLIDKLVTDKEMEGLLKWALEGLLRMLERHKLSYPFDKEEKYLIYQQNIDYFVEHSYIKGQFDDWAYAEDIKKDYALWCKENNVPIDSPNALGRTLSREGYTLDKITVGKSWKYIRRYLKR